MSRRDLAEISGKVRICTKKSQVDFERCEIRCDLIEEGEFSGVLRSRLSSKLDHADIFLTPSFSLQLKLTADDFEGDLKVIRFFDGSGFLKGEILEDFLKTRVSLYSRSFLDWGKVLEISVYKYMELVGSGRISLGPKNFFGEIFWKNKKFSLEEGMICSGRCETIF